MASSLDFVQYVCDQIVGAGEIKHKRLFGEYGIYCDGKFIGVVCNNQFFVKRTEEGAKILMKPQEATLREGANPYYVVDKLEDKKLLVDFVRVTCDALPAPKAGRKTPQLI